MPAERTPYGVVLLEMMDDLNAVIDAVAGYRRRAEEAGFSPTAAEHMALQYHHVMMHAVLTGTHRAR